MKGSGQEEKGGETARDIWKEVVRSFEQLFHQSPLKRLRGQMNHCVVHRGPDEASEGRREGLEADDNREEMWHREGYYPKHYFTKV